MCLSCRFTAHDVYTVYNFHIIMTWEIEGYFNSVIRVETNESMLTSSSTEQRPTNSEETHTFAGINTSTVCFS